MDLSSFFRGESTQLRCPGCNRVIDGSVLQPGERFKCSKCRKLMRFGPHLFDPDRVSTWRMGRVVLLVACIGVTVWILTAGYDFGLRTGRWAAGFGGAMVLWLLVAGCIGLASRTTQDNGVLLGVTSTMCGVALFFLVRLGRHVGYNVGDWLRYRHFSLWAPGLIVVGAVLLTASLLIQRRYRSL